MTSRIEDILPQIIIGGLASATVMAVWWLATGGMPPLWVAWLGGPVLIWAVVRLHRLRVRRETATLADLYDRPAYGEEED